MEATGTEVARISGERSLASIIMVFSMLGFSKEIVLPVDVAMWEGCAEAIVLEVQKSHIKMAKAFGDFQRAPTGY